MRACEATPLFFWICISLAAARRRDQRRCLGHWRHSKQRMYFSLIFCNKEKGKRESTHICAPCRWRHFDGTNCRLHMTLMPGRKRKKEKDPTTLPKTTGQFRLLFFGWWLDAPLHRFVAKIMKQKGKTEKKKEDASACARVARILPMQKRAHCGPCSFPSFFNCQYRRWQINIQDEAKQQFHTMSKRRRSCMSTARATVSASGSAAQRRHVGCAPGNGISERGGPTS